MYTSSADHRNQENSCCRVQVATDNSSTVESPARGRDFGVFAATSIDTVSSQLANVAMFQTTESPRQRQSRVEGGVVGVKWW